MSPRPDLATVAELVRLPAVLSVPGDVLVGASTSRRRPSPATALGLAASSALLYLGGMALNDYADREEDARERPSRPIPSGRVTPGFTLGLAGGLTLAGVAAAGIAAGPAALRITVPLAGTVWAYDLWLKHTPAGPAAMALARGLDVLVGASGGPLRPALPSAGVVGGHTLLVTTISRRETTGADASLLRAGLASTAVLTAAAATLAAGDRHARPLARAAGAALVGSYAASFIRAQAEALQDPSPAKLQRVVGRGILSLLPLQAGLMARRAPALVTAAVASAWPLARRLARRRAVT